MRLERITLTALGAGATAAVDLLEPTGLANIVHLEVAGQPVKTVTTQLLKLKAGARVGRSLAPENQCLFAPKTGEWIKQLT